MSVTVLVVDDEPLARRKLSVLIATVPWLAQVGEAADGASAVSVAQRLLPDVLFLDIRMPELSGLQVVERLSALPRPPLVVFTTAYDRYAVSAFELEAIDYLLKPFGRERFLRAIERVRDRLDAGAAGAALDRAQAVLRDPITGAPLDRIMVNGHLEVVASGAHQSPTARKASDHLPIWARVRPVADRPA